MPHFAVNYSESKYGDVTVCEVYNLHASGTTCSWEEHTMDALSEINILRLTLMLQQKSISVGPSFTDFYS